MADELENLTGVVEGITYRNEANGYAVIEVKPVTNLLPLWAFWAILLSGNKLSFKVSGLCIQTLAGSLNLFA